jgi:class 3 adenylate cyclase
MQMNREIDVRNVLPTVHVPTLIAHRIGDRNISIQEARYMVKQMPSARLVELPGEDHMLWFGDNDALLGEIEEFLTGVRQEPEPDRVLATVLFTDIVNSTERAAEMGDRKWRDLLASHHSSIRRELGRYSGREIDTAGDGFFATFDGPARAIHCAEAIKIAITQLGLTIRIGLHTGECEVIDDKITGIAVHIGARVMSLASQNEILVTSTVKDLVAGSGIGFADRSLHALKGINGEWRLFAVT